MEFLSLQIDLRCLVAAFDAANKVCPQQRMVSGAAAASNRTRFHSHCLEMGELGSKRPMDSQ